MGNSNTVKDLREMTSRVALNRRQSWALNHVAACDMAQGQHERAVLVMARGITFYARAMVANADTDERGTVFDGVLSRGVGRMLSGFLELLNGPIGRLDGGTCDAWARQIAHVVEWDLDMDQPAKDQEPATYRIVRRYQSDDYAPETVKTGLTLDEAQAHCHDPETSSSSATLAEGTARTARRGPWFDGYEKE